MGFNGISHHLMGFDRNSCLMMIYQFTYESGMMEIRPHRFGGEGVLIGGQQQH